MAGQFFKAENGLLVTGNTSLFEKEVTMNANLSVSGSTMFIGQNLIISGNLIYANTSVAGDLYPNINGINLGNTTNRFNGYFTNVNFSGTISPVANGGVIGSPTQRVFVYSFGDDIGGNLTVAGNVAINSTAFVVDSTNKKASVNSAIGSSEAFKVVGLTSLTNTSVTGNLLVSGGVSTVGNLRMTSNTKSVTNTSLNIIDSFPKTESQFSKITIAALGTGLIHKIDLTIVHDNTNVLLSKYGELYNTFCGNFDVNINNANVEISFTPTVANNYSVKTIREMVI